MSDTYKTRESLLFRVKQQNDQEAWEDFTRLYQPFVHILLRKLSISITYSDDIAQEVMVEIWHSVGKFELGGRAKFRTWLMSLVRNHAYQYMKKIFTSQNRDSKYASQNNQFGFGSEPVDVDFFDELYQKEWEAYVCTLAFNSVKEKFVGNGIKVFEMSLDGVEVAEIASKLALKPETVYQLRNRVKSALVKEISQLRNQLEL